MRRLLYLLTGWLLVTQSVSAQFPWQSFEFFNLSGGVNDSFDPTAIENNEASDLQNVVFTTGGAIKKREGSSRINSTAAPSASAVTTGGHFYKLSDGTRYLVRLVNDTTDLIQKMDYGAGTTGPDGTWDDITGATGIAVGNDHQGDFAQAFDTLVIEDGVNTTAPYKWTGTGNAAVLGGSPPEATMVEYHKNHLWSAGDSDNRSRVVFSNICTTSSSCIETYTATDFFELDTNDGQVITGLKSGLDCLYIWKTNSIWRICGSSRDTFTQEQMVRDIGTQSNSSIAVINNQFLFKTQLGDYAVYDGGINVRIISSKIEGTLGNLNQNRLDAVRAVAFDDGTGDQDYYACETQTGGSTHNRVLLYDTFHQSWTKFVGLNCNAIWDYEIGTFERAIAFGDYSGFVSRYPNTNADAGAAISAYWQSGQWRVPEIPLRKTFRIAQLYVEQSGNYNLTFTHKIDFESTGTATSCNLAGSGALWDTAIFDADTYGDVTTTICRVDVNEGDYFFQWRVSNNAASQPWTVKGLRIWVEQTGRE